MRFRNLAISVGVLGIAMGVAFGAGFGMGRGNPKEVQVGLTQAQIQQLYGAPSNPAAAGGGATGGPAAGVAAPGAGTTQGAAAPAQASANLGRVTAIQGSTVTIETSSGTSTRLNLSTGAKVSKLSDGAASDLAAGAVVWFSGQRRDDGSYDVTALSQVPSELQQSAGTRPATAPTQTP